MAVGAAEVCGRVAIRIWKTVGIEDLGLRLRKEQKKDKGLLMQISGRTQSLV